ncbi:MAG: zinc dependent phospholipase C family protein [Candidatus ainarchaeum sp.]|nr:zinc dependent phospholipase C family protein [Candidatus ainarchaeum sp.]
MSHFNTHIKFVESLNSNLDKRYLFSGSVFPDIGLYVDFSKINKEKDFTHFLHFPEPRSENGIKFGKALMEKAKTKKELSFAVGVYSHFFLDQTVHSYIMKNNLPMAEHIMLEFFRAHNDFLKRVKKLYLPKEFCVSVFEETFPTDKEYAIQIREVGWLKLFKFRFINDYLLRHLIKTNYGEKQKKLWLVKLVFSFFRAGYKKKEGEDLYSYLYPSLILKKVHLSNMDRIIAKTQKEFLKDLVVNWNL